MRHILNVDAHIVLVEIDMKKCILKSSEKRYKQDLIISCLYYQKTNNNHENHKQAQLNHESCQTYTSRVVVINLNNLFHSEWCKTLLVLKKKEAFLELSINFNS